MKKRGLIFLLCVMLLISLSVVAEAKDRTTIKIWTGYPEEVPVYKAAAEDYIKEHPDVNIEISSFNLRQAEQKLAIAVPAGIAPDIYIGGSNIAMRYVQAGMLASIPDSMLPWIKKYFEQGFIDSVSSLGKIYAIPWKHGFQVLYYNKDHYREVGLTQPPKNLDDLMEYARKLVKYDKNGNIIRSGISLRLSGGGMGVAEKFEIFLFANGGSVLVKTAPGKWKANFANEAGYKALNFYLQALYKYHVDSYNIKHDAEAFLLGITSQFNRETWVIGEAKNRAPEMDYGITQVVGGIEHATNLAEDCLFVPACSKHQNVAWDFAKYLNNDKYLVQMMRDVGWICTRNNVDYSEVYKIEPHFEQAYNRPNNFKLIPTLTLESSNEIYTKFASGLVEVFKDVSMLDNKERIMKFLREEEKIANSILEKSNLYGE